MLINIDYYDNDLTSINNEITLLEAVDFFDQDICNCQLEILF